MIDVTGIDKVKLVKEAYALSRSQGLGFLQRPGSDISDDEILNEMEPDGTIHLDYVHGRAFKFGIFKEGDKFFINAPWYDHTDEQLVALLAHVGITYEPGQTDHGYSCNCDPCRIKRGEGKLGPLGI